MATRREWIEAEEKRLAERARTEESEQARHLRYLEGARTKGIRNLTAAEYQQVVLMVHAPEREGGCVGWPLDAPAMFNGSGEPCDMWTGPCSCGAAHRDGI